jgi:cytochrome P450
MAGFQPGDASFDPALGAWVLTRYADVSAALSDPRLVPPGAAADDPVANLAVRDAGTEAMSSARLAGWQPELERSARRLIAALPAGVSLDLVQGFARPWSLALAIHATGAPAEDSERLAHLAGIIFLAAARSPDGEPQPEAQSAVRELADLLPAASGPIGVQAFVALSHTLPGLLASVWLELLRHPAELDRLRASPALIPQATEELLRYASPARAVFRRALTAVTIGAAPIAAGDRVILMLAAANRDPAQFPEPDRLDFGRGSAGHLTFGRGTHSCLGSQLIRLAAATATATLLGATSVVELAGEVEWIGGFAIRAPGSLPVVLGRA